MSKDNKNLLKQEDGYIIPSHYMGNKYQTIEFLREFLNEKQYCGFCAGLSIKYISRSNENNRVRNYTKAKYYLDECINYLNSKDTTVKTDQNRITPDYYKKGNIEVIDMIDDQFGTDMDLLIGFYSGVIIKYLFRFTHKHGLEDLEKAKYYLDRILTIIK